MKMEKSVTTFYESTYADHFMFNSSIQDYEHPNYGG
jgi:hypothetical protein